MTRRRLDAPPSVRYWGFYLRFGEADAAASSDPATNRRLQQLSARLLETAPDGVLDVVPSYANVFVAYDPMRLTPEPLTRWLRAAAAGTSPASARRAVRVPLRYDGPDLEEVGHRSGLGAAEVARRHASVSYHVYALGFLPGFAFMGRLEPALRLPRRERPRARVPAHSVGIANDQTGVYPSSSPGGWNLLGTALVAAYDPHRERPFLFEPGDDVRFVPSDGTPPPEPVALELLPTEPCSPALRVLRPGLLDLVVDRGRFGVGRFGLAQGGAADPGLARLANHLVGNRADAPTLELNLSGPVLEVLRDTVVALAGWAMTPRVDGRPEAAFRGLALRRGQVLSFHPTRFCTRAYLAVAGGLESATFLGSASTSPRAGIGRPLEEGATLGVAAAGKGGGVARTARPGHGFLPYHRASEVETVRLLPGPQASAEAMASLTARSFVVAAGDRMGIELEPSPGGPAIEGGEVTSEATPLGAVQVPPGGRPIVLLVDRGTVGGYAKPAVVHPADLPRLTQTRPGQKVRFVAVAGAAGMQTLDLEGLA